MRISWRPRNARVSAVLVTGLIAIAVPVLPGPVALAATAHAGVPRPTATATGVPRPTATAAGVPLPTATATGVSRPTATGGAVPRSVTHVKLPKVPALTISVSDGRTAANTGDQLTYVVRVQDGGAVSAPHLTITQTLSAGLEFLSASRNGKAAHGKVAWYTSVRAGGTESFRMVARVTRTPARLLRLAAVACASAQGSRTPIVCAAHLDQLPAATAVSVPGAARPGVIRPAYAMAALAVLAAGVLAAIAARRFRLRRRLS